MTNSRYIIQSFQLLDKVKRSKLSESERINLSIELAGNILNEARRIQTSDEKKTQQQLARMMDDVRGKAFTTAMTDQGFRSKSSWRAADQITYLLDKYGIPKYLFPVKKTLLSLFHYTGKSVAPLVVPLVKEALRDESSNVILPGEPKAMLKHMRKRRMEGVRINLNHLGEAILGEEEANQRLEVYLDDLRNPEVECISVKVSTLYSQIHLLGWEKTVEVLMEKLKLLYRTAQQNMFTLMDGRKVPKFVNLDMEEYKDLHLTVDLFRRTLNEPEFFQFSAGIVLQSYLPDSFIIQQQLTTWAMQRVASGGAPIKIRIVKGANLAMEQVEASLRGWEQAPYHHKSEVDANFKRMVEFGCVPEHAKAANLGIASHNLFHLAYGMLLRAENGVEREVCFEMLEGMFDPARRIVQTLSRDVLLYCPVAKKEEFQNAIAYLIRRLDENTAPQNFLRHVFNITPGTKPWDEQARLFSESFREVKALQSTPNRKQNRLDPPKRYPFDAPFHNEPDTDWSLPQNRIWGQQIADEWKNKQISSIRELGTIEQIDPLLETAQKGMERWNKKPFHERMLLLDKVAHGLRIMRRDLIGAMMAETKKTMMEADVEISEAIDFVEYYRRSANELHYLPDIKWSPKGTILVTPPWNFPCSIPVGGIAAALAGGNSVILKPAPEAVFVGWMLANIFWDAGIDKEVLQFFCCDDDPVGSALIKDPRVSMVLLTGATSTAKHFLKMRPTLDLAAETGGKNAMIISALADRDLAVKDLVQSAFGHAGQKCSACSLAILEEEVYHDPNFRKQLKDAVQSLKVGSVWDLSAKVNPLIRSPNPDLMRGLTTLDEGEEWLVKPEQDKENPHLWSPGVKFGVKPGSFMHQTELFGPVLGVMCAKDLDQAVKIANATPYGLTSGLHSLDEREQKYWLENIEAGNCYVNRTITGAIVRRQPFGGCKESSFGRGAKAGGPNYVVQMMHPEQVDIPNEREPIKENTITLNRLFHQTNYSDQDLEVWNASLGSYAFYWNHYFSRQHDPSKVLGQDNILRYAPLKKLVLRVQKGDSQLDVWRALAAALTCNTPMEISASPEAKDILPPKVQVIIETDEEFVNKKQVWVRFLSKPSENVVSALECNVVVAPVLANGRLELLNYLREVSISSDYHRYGYLGLHDGAMSGF